MLNGEATNTNFIVFSLTWSGLAPTIYRTRGEHSNHYATNAVENKEEIYNKQQDYQCFVYAALLYEFNQFNPATFFLLKCLYQASDI
jgi:hypothetical protein